MDFSEWLNQQMQEMGLTPSVLAYRVGVKDSTVSKWRTGAAKPLPVQCAQIAKVLGVSTDEVLSRAGRGGALAVAQRLSPPLHPEMEDLLWKVDKKTQGDLVEVLRNLTPALVAMAQLGKIGQTASSTLPDFPESDTRGQSEEPVSDGERESDDRMGRRDKRTQAEIDADRRAGKEDIPPFMAEPEHSNSEPKREE